MKSVEVDLMTAIKLVTMSATEKSHGYWRFKKEKKEELEK